MLLLFEGVDKSGKSTLIKNFTANNYTPVWKNTVFKPVSSTFSIGMIQGLYTGFYEGYKLCGRQPLFSILDRSHITEIVYAPVKRNYQANTTFWFEYEQKLEAVVVYVDTPHDTICERLDLTADDYVDYRDVSQIRMGYQEYLARTCLPVIRIDGSKSEVEMLNELNAKLNEYLRNKGRS